jgi:RIO-like serine/threonine protein kinase
LDVINTNLPPASDGLPFTYTEFSHAATESLSVGRCGRASVSIFRNHSGAWVVKDFRRVNPFVRWTWCIFMVRRELRAFERLRGLRGIPQDAFRVNRFSLAYRYTPGAPIGKADPALMTPAFFEKLESLVREMHARSIVHLDMRYSRNVLVGDDGLPTLLDFQSYANLKFVPAFLHQLLKNTDLSGVYKHWNKKQPGTLGPEREALMAQHMRLRRFWFIKGLAGFNPQWRRNLRKKRKNQHA